MNIGSEVFERIDAHDRVELVIRKRELAYVRIHRCDGTLDTGLAETSSSSSTLTHRSHAVTVTPHSRARTTEVAPRPQPRSRNPTSRLERERQENVFKLPERMRSHFERNDPPRVVPRRQRIAIGPDRALIADTGEAYGRHSVEAHVRTVAQTIRSTCPISSPRPGRA